MSNSVTNLEKLTDQIYKEGIEKAQKQSEKILHDAETEKAKILKQAKAEADKIIEEADRKSQQLKASVESELDLKAKQFISDLKIKIHNLLSKKIVETNTTDALANATFIQTLITNIVKHWQGNKDLELILPKKLEGEIKDAFSRSIQEVAPNMIITFENHLNSGFRIARKDENYQISFSDDDFIAIFKTYLTEQTEKVLFKSAE